MPSLQEYVITGTTPAAAGTAAVGGKAVGLRQFDELKFVAELVGATGDTLDVYLQWSPDAGTTWYDYAHFPQLAAGAAAIKYVCTSQFGTTLPVVIGKGTTPALAANTCTGGGWGDQMRCIATAGASTSAGAAITITIFGRYKKV
jgi:hypothetical protein